MTYQIDHLGIAVKSLAAAKAIYEKLGLSVTPVETVDGTEITTLEGLGTIQKPHPIQKAFIEEGAAQCGFCLNAVIMTAKAFLDKKPKSSDEEIQQAMSGVLCRCFTHVRMLRAIKKAGQEMAR